MKVVVTGASGLLGRATAEEFRKSGWEGKKTINKVYPQELTLS